MDQFTRKFGIVDKRTETREIITAVYDALLVKILPTSRTTRMRGRSSAIWTGTSFCRSWCAVI